MQPKTARLAWTFQIKLVFEYILAHRGFVSLLREKARWRRDDPMGIGHGGNKEPCSLVTNRPCEGLQPLFPQEDFSLGVLCYFFFFFFADNWYCQKFYADLLILENSRKHPWLHESRASTGTVPVSTVMVLGGGIPGNSISPTSLPQARRGSLAIMMHWKCALRHHFWRKLSFNFTDASCWWTGWGWKILRAESAFPRWEQDWSSSQPWALGPERGMERRGESEGDRRWGLQTPEWGDSAGTGWKPEQTSQAFCIIPWLPGVLVTGLQGECTNRLSQPSQHVL